MIADLGYIDNAIRIIDTDCNASLTKTKPYQPRMSAFRGEMSRFVLGHLRSTRDPATTLELAYKVMDGRPLDKNDQRAVSVIRKRVGPVSINCGAKGWCGK